MTARNASPRDLDPNFKDAEVPTNNETDLDKAAPKDDDRVMIVHQERYMDGSVQKVRSHGPMPIEDWDDYAKEHGF